MCIYSIVNVENMKLYEPSMLDQELEQVLPSVEELTLEDEDELEKDTVLWNNSTTTRRG